MNAVGLDHDVMTLLHEAGHAFHALRAAPQALYSYRHAPMEFCEVASMSMELIAGEHVSFFYTAEDAGVPGLLILRISWRPWPGWPRSTPFNF